MPSRARSDIELAQQACVMIGANRIESFNESESTEALVLSVIYEDVIRDCLTATRWNFAASKMVLASRNADAPLTGYSAAYTYIGDDTDDILQVNTVEVNGSVADYDIVENEIHVDAGANDEVVLNYTKRVEVQYWPPFFTLYALMRLCTVLATAIVRNASMAEEFDNLTQRQLTHARSKDSQQVTTRRFRMTRILSARMAGGAR